MEPSPHLLYKGDLFLTSRFPSLLFPESYEEKTTSKVFATLTDDFRKDQEREKLEI
jgi:hypothetical protein